MAFSGQLPHYQSLWWLVISVRHLLSWLAQYWRQIPEFKAFYFYLLSLGSPTHLLALGRSGIQFAYHVLGGQTVINQSSIHRFAASLNMVCRSFRVWLLSGVGLVNGHLQPLNIFLEILNLLFEIDQPLVTSPFWSIRRSRQFDVYGLCKVHGTLILERVQAIVENSFCINIWKVLKSMVVWG